MTTKVTAAPFPDTVAAEAGSQSRVLVPELGHPMTAVQCAEFAVRLLDRYPDAGVAAIAASGRFVAMPPAVRLAGHRVISGHDTALELVVPADIVPTIEAWKTACAAGAGVADVHPLDEPDARLALYFVDTRGTYGVLLGIAVTPNGVAPSIEGMAAPEPLNPRLTVARTNQLAELVDVDAAFTALLGYPHDRVVGTRTLELIHPDEHNRAIASWVDLLSQAGGTRQQRLRYLHADGHWMWFDVTSRNLLDDPDEECVVSNMINISDEVAAQEGRQADQQLLARLTDVVPVGILQIDRDRRVVRANSRLVDILGRRDTETLAGLFAGVATEDLRNLDDACATVLERGVDVDLEVGLHHPRRGPVRCRVTLRPLGDEAEITGAVACIEDVTEPARLRAQLEFRATYDALTGCLNRTSVLAELGQALGDAAREGTGTAVAFVDLDGFTAVNETRGQAAGDALLRDVARHLGAAARRGDAVGRVGGDQFLVIGRGVGSAEQARAVGQRLAAGLAANVAPVPPRTTVASCGVAWSPGAGPSALTADHLIARAHEAMLAAKRAGDGHAAMR